jgi:hypothetical protein
MTVTDSRLGPGTLTLGTMTGAGCQMGNVKLVPSRDEEDGTPTLCEPKPAPLITTTWALEGTAVQDWEKDDGFVEFCRLNDGTTVPFSWVPNTGKGITYAGNVQVRAVEFGGDVAKQNTTDFAFPVVGDVARTKAPVPPVKSAAAPGDVFSLEPTVTASDAPNAAKLGPLGYVAAPATAWTGGQGVTIATYEFHWDGAAWAAGVA